MRNSKPTRIGDREQPVVHISADEQVQNGTGTAAYNHGTEKRRPTFSEEGFYMRIFVGENGPADCADEYREDNYYEDERRAKEVDVKVRYPCKKAERDKVA